jgi:glycosyltransferase involved in cell wall biosynthesis
VKQVVLSVLQDPRGKGGTATAVGAYRRWMDRHRPNSRHELILDEQRRGSVAALRRWTADDHLVPRVLPKLQIVPYLAARRVCRRRAPAADELHVIGASAVHGSTTISLAPSLVWLATTLADERRPDVLRGRSASRRVAYRLAQPVLSHLEADVLRAARRVLAMSRHTADVVVEVGVDPRRVEVVPVPVDTHHYQLPPNGAARHGVLFVGRAHDPRKGFDRLAGLVAGDHLSGRPLTVVSSGPSVDIDGHVEWLGTVDDLAPVYQSAELLVLPSRQEGLGIVALEAMACGTPVVARRCGGVDHILDESGGGYATTDADEFAAVVARLLSDPDLAAGIGASGRAWVARHAAEAEFLARDDLFRL